MTEKEYRLLDLDSYSSLSTFLKDRKSYAREYVYKDSLQKEEKSFLTIGSVVDCLTLTPEDFDDKFVINNDIKTPIGQMLDFTMCLYSRSITYINGWEEIVPITDELILDCYNTIGFKRDSIEKVKEKFENDCKEYYNYLLKCRGKTVISKEDHKLALKISEALKKSSVTGILINRESDDRTTVLNQLIVIYEYDGLELKSMMDKVVIDHDSKTIRLYDLKTAYNPEEFEENYYKYNYYIQAALYYIALRQWAKKNNYIDKGYTVEYMRFIVCDNTNYYSPLIYKTDEDHFVQGICGFYRRGKYYKGLKQVISELKWHKRNNIWNMSHDNFKEEGIVRITLGEDELDKKGEYSDNISE